MMISESTASVKRMANTDYDAIINRLQAEGFTFTSMEESGLLQSSIVRISD